MSSPGVLPISAAWQDNGGSGIVGLNFGGGVKTGTFPVGSLTGAFPTTGAWSNNGIGIPSGSDFVANTNSSGGFSGGDGVVSYNGLGTAAVNGIPVAAFSNFPCAYFGP